MIVTLDTNILYNDFRMNGSLFNILLGSKDKLGIKVKVPELVFQETVNKYSEKLKSDIADLEEDTTALEKKLGRQINNEIKDLDIKEETENYRAYLKEKFENNDIEIVNTPNVELNEIIEKDLNRKKPFSKSSGYRDYIIWRTVARMGRISIQEEIIFISHNTSDFSDGDGNLHHDLSDELENLQIPNTYRYGYLTHLGAFNEKYILPHLTKLESINEELSQRGFDELDLHAWVKDNLYYILDEETLLIVGGDLNPGVGQAGIPTLISPPKIENEEIYKLGNSDLALKFDLTLNVEYDIDLTNQDFFASPRLRNFFDSWGDSTIGWHNIFQLEMELIVDGNTGKIRTFDTISMDKKISILI